MPASRYRPSRQAFPEALPLPDYQGTDQVRRVRPDGSFKWKGKLVSLSQAFAGPDAALRPTERDGVMTLHFMRFDLGELDSHTATAVVNTVRDVLVHPSTIPPV